MKATEFSLTFSEQDFRDLASGKANPMQSFMSGKIKFKGNMGVLMKVSDCVLWFDSRKLLRAMVSHILICACVVDARVSFVLFKICGWSCFFPRRLQPKLEKLRSKY